MSEMTRYVLSHSICRYRDKIYIISSFEQSEKHIDFVKQKYRADFRLHIEKNGVSKSFIDF